MTKRGSSTRRYSDRTLKILWGRAAGRCAVSTCRIELLADATDHDPIVVIGDIAHIEAASNLGPRANKSKARKERDEYDNLILLCKNCHARLDGQKHTNTVESIRHLRNDHEAWVRASLPERGRSTIGWQVVLLRGQHPIDVESALAALSPSFAANEPMVITAIPGEQTWNAIYDVLVDQVGALCADNDLFNCRFAVFPLAPVSACIALGYLLTNRPHARVFQYYRDERSWSWPENGDLGVQITISGLPNIVTQDAAEVAFCFHLSASISGDALTETGVALDKIVHISIAQPNTGWLRKETQLAELAKAVRQAFETCTEFYPRCRKWHLFCAAPASVAVTIGQQINQTMCPPVQLYEFSRSAKPVYQPSLLLIGA